jgi:hypothetical protein
MNIVENYKKRRLSYPKIDFWNAFSGITPEIEETLLWYWIVTLNR